jgi:hypothetical protein
VSRAGLNTAEAVASSAEFAGETGIGSVSPAALAERIGVEARAPSKYVVGVGDLRHRIATMAKTELGDGHALALQAGRGRDATKALFTALPSCIADHPERS